MIDAEEMRRDRTRTVRNSVPHESPIANDTERIIKSQREKVLPKKAAFLSVQVGHGLNFVRETVPHLKRSIWSSDFGWTRR